MRAGSEVWIGYLAFPTLGPRVAPAIEAQVLGGTWISQLIRVTLHLFEGNLLDAFPSGHVAASLVYFGYGWAHFPRWRLLLVAVEAALLFSTVYLSLHYIVDLLAGVLLAGAVIGVVLGAARAPMSVGHRWARGLHE